MPRGETSELTYTGGCRCGAVRYRAAGPAQSLCYCHCERCRRSAGAPMVAWGTFTAEGFAVTAGALALHRSSPGVTRGGCAVCGTSITYQREKRSHQIDVTLVSLDNPALLAPACHIYVEEKLPWLVINDALPQYQRTKREG